MRLLCSFDQYTVYRIETIVNCLAPLCIIALKWGPGGPSPTSTGTPCTSTVDFRYIRTFRVMYIYGLYGPWTACNIFSKALISHTRNTECLLKSTVLPTQAHVAYKHVPLKFAFFQNVLFKITFYLSAHLAVKHLLFLSTLVHSLWSHKPIRLPLASIVATIREYNLWLYLRG